MAEECSGCFIECGWLLFIEPLTVWVQTLRPLGRGRVGFSADESDGLAWTVHHGSVKRHSALPLSKMGVWKPPRVSAATVDGQKISKAGKMSNLSPDLEMKSIPSKPSYETCNVFGRFSSSLNLYISPQSKLVVLRPLQIECITNKEHKIIVVPCVRQGRRN